MLRFFVLSSFSEWQENVGRKSSNFSQVTVFAFTGEQLFPSWLLVAGCRVEKCSATSAKTRCNSVYVKFRIGVVCRKCCCKLINKSARDL